jgi:hypothetical protein
MRFVQRTRRHQRRHEGRPRGRDLISLLRRADARRRARLRPRGRPQRDGRAGRQRHRENSDPRALVGPSSSPAATTLRRLRRTWRRRRASSSHSDGPTSRIPTTWRARRRGGRSTRPTSRRSTRRGRRAIPIIRDHSNDCARGKVLRPRTAEGLTPEPGRGREVFDLAIVARLHALGSASRFATVRAHICGSGDQNYPCSDAATIASVQAFPELARPRLREKRRSA